MKALRNASFALLLINILFAQRINRVDLTRLPETPKIAGNLPNGCKKLSNGMIADGWMEPEDHAPEHIVVEVVSMKDTKPVLGSEVVAEVQLRNADTRPIKIPWRTEFRAIQNGQSPDALQWQAGTFEFRLSNQQGEQVWIKSLTASLYGAKASPGSQLTLAPGEGITALVKFKLEEEYPIPPLRLVEGEWQLTAKWILTGRSWAVRNCISSNAYFHDHGFYQQQNLGLTIQVTTGPATSQKSSE